MMIGELFQLKKKAEEQESTIPEECEALGG